MKKGLLERLEAYPELKKLTEEMLDIVEDASGTLQRADEAETQVVHNIRKMGAAALHEWAACQEKKVIAKCREEHPSAEKHGKKKSIGRQPLVGKK